MSELRPDNVAEWDPHWFAKSDGSPDDLFYQLPRKVVHIDDGAIAAVTALYAELLPAGGVILDLMSSWRSHLPPALKFARVVGLGMNRAELADNPQLDEYLVQDLNHKPQLPFAPGLFDAVVCCVSVQYLQQPVAVFGEVARVLKPGAPFVLTFSNRCFPNKAIQLWRYTSDEQHMHLVEIYFAASQRWRNITRRDCIPQAAAQGVDPLYAVWAFSQQVMSDE